MQTTVINAMSIVLSRTQERVRGSARRATFARVLRSGIGTRTICCDRRNHSFCSLVYQQYPSLWHLLQYMQQDESAAVVDIVAAARGQLPAKRLRRNAQQHQQCLQKLVLQHRGGVETTVQLLDALGHCIRLAI